MRSSISGLPGQIAGTTTVLEPPSVNASPLSLRIVRGPLSNRENEVVLSEYNRRIPPPAIPMDEFVRCVQDSPDGPAWHGILETDSDGIVGHQCFIPLRGNYGRARVIAAKSEYTFLDERFRTICIRGFEQSKRPTHIVAANQLAQRCYSEGWGPLLISTIPSLRRRGFYGFVARDFQLRECLLVLRPLAAAREIANVAPWQRLCLGLSGALQSTGWKAIASLVTNDAKLLPVHADSSALPEGSDSRLEFFQDLDSLRWRYPVGHYERIDLSVHGKNSYLIYKKGSPTQFMRVCQWSIEASGLSVRAIARLLQIAERDEAIGVRWAVYGDDQGTRGLVRRLRRLGFVCAPRVRVLQVRADNKDFFNPNAWNLNDAMFSFHW